MAVLTLPPLPIPEEQFTLIARKMDLSPQQARVVALILRNCSDKEIAMEMQLKVSTVRTYLGRLFSRLGVQNRLGVVLKIVAVLHTECPRYC
jgi:DNA-binding CsgD family transcriptional regulator